MRKKTNVAALRHRMVEEQIRGRGIRDPRILQAIESIPRHLFVPYANPADAYRDGPLPIGLGQTISQPFITAYMTQLLRPRPEHRILEIGTGSGYQAALLSLLCGQVYTIEIISNHHARAGKLLAELKYTNVHLRLGDGQVGWPDEAPFNGIIVTAAAQASPPPDLSAQLADGGRLVIPVGRSLYDQQLMFYTRKANQIIAREDIAVRFVPILSGKPGRAA
ncbi:MAG: protein-L-isoaspartate(D-aspartate) O-methyltransferase [Candidatus Neomarinimicrobiota bacterium]